LTEPTSLFNPGVRELGDLRALLMARVRSQTVVMSNLGVLRSDNIVRRKREGKHIVYSLADQQVLDLMVRGKFGGEKRPGGYSLDE
jgi:DNA-binding transcriptional ArsR family regulator